MSRSANKRGASHVEEDIVAAIGMTTKHVDIHRIKREKVPLYKLLLPLVGISTYLGTYAIDALVLSKYYAKSRWLWFGFTSVCFVVPTIIIQLLSLKWFHDGGGLKVYTIVTHLFCLGPVDRYLRTIYNGAIARRKMKSEPTLGDRNLVKFLEHQRDVSMLRFLYGFLESSPQATLQLYVLMQQTDAATNMCDLVKENVFTIIKLMVCFVALAWGVVSYNGHLRDAEGRELSIPGCVIQCLYRLFLIASRVVALVLFAVLFNWIVLVVIFLHCVVMCFWVRYDNCKFFNKAGKVCNNTCEILFQMIMGYIYIFCYVATKDGSTATSQLAYYLLFHVENISMMTTWVAMNDKKFDVFEVSAVAVFASTMILGIIFHAVYYQCVHPSMGSKCCRRSLKDERSEALLEEENSLKVRKEKCFFQRSRIEVAAVTKSEAELDIMANNEETKKIEDNCEIIETSNDKLNIS